MANRKNGTLYIGVTGNLIRRVYEHKHHIIAGFTSRYEIHKLVYFEITENIHSAIIREKQLKKWKREWKVILIEKENPFWRDLYADLL